MDCSEGLTDLTDAFEEGCAGSCGIPGCTVSLPAMRVHGQGGDALHEPPWDLGIGA